MKTAEWVSPKHPDKICDQISDAILDLCLMQDARARVAVECFGCHGQITIGGEITFNGILENSDIHKIVKRLTGYAKNRVSINIVKQSVEIANGVDTGGAGDQGIMVGYACDDNVNMIPQELEQARSLGEFLFAKYPYDGKTEIVLDDDGKIFTIVASFQKVSKEKLKASVNEWLSKGIIPDRCEILCNPAGDWKIGGFDADTGLTGRKLMVDNYGPQIAIGGGCFSGKDSTKVDRSGAYMARKIARDILISNKAKSVLVKIAYAIGVAQPVMVTVEMRKHDGTLIDKGWNLSDYDLTPNGIIKFLKLREPIFEKTAREGHFGKNNTWDK